MGRGNAAHQRVALQQQEERNALLRAARRSQRSRAGSGHAEGPRASSGGQSRRTSEHGRSRNLLANTLPDSDNEVGIRRQLSLERLISRMQTDGLISIMTTAFEAEELMMAQALQMSQGVHMAAMTAMKQIDAEKRQRTDKFLQAFFDSCITVGEWAVAEGLLDVDDLVCGEPHLYIAIPALVMIEVALPKCLCVGGCSIIYGDIILGYPHAGEAAHSLSLAQAKETTHSLSLAQAKDAKSDNDAFLVNVDAEAKGAREPTDMTEEDGAKDVVGDTESLTAAEAKDAGLRSEAKLSTDNATKELERALEDLKETVAAEMKGLVDWNRTSEADAAASDAKEEVVEAEPAMVTSSTDDSKVVGFTEGEVAESVSTPTAEARSICTEAMPVEEKFCFLLAGKPMWCDCEFGEGENGAKLCVDDDNDRRVEAVCCFTRTIREVREMMEDCDLSKKQLHLLRRMVMGLADGKSSAAETDPKEEVEPVKKRRSRTQSVTTLVAQICSDVSASATEISQMPIFKSRFNYVLENLLDKLETTQSDMEFTTSDPSDLAIAKDPDLDLPTDNFDLSLSSEALEFSTASQDGYGH